MAIQRSELISCWSSPRAKTRSSLAGFIGWFVAGSNGGGGSCGRSASRLYQAVGISFSLKTMRLLLMNRLSWSSGSGALRFARLEHDTKRREA